MPVLKIKEDGEWKKVSKVNMLSGGGTGGIPSAATAEFGKTKISEFAPAGKSWFNGVLLPDIPTDLLAQYPYCWIRNNGTTGYYDLVFSTEQFYLVDSSTVSGNGIVKPWYRVEITKAETATEWTSNGTSDLNFGIDTNRTVMWSNHDIPNGSATATDIYFEGTEPIKEMVTGYGDFVSSSEYYAVTNEAINEIAHKMQERYSSYETYSGAEVRDFIKRCDFYEKGNAESVTEMNSLLFDGNAVGALT